MRNTLRNCFDGDFLGSGGAGIFLKPSRRIRTAKMVPADPEIWFWTYPKEFRKGLDHYKVLLRLFKYN